jgi:cob(I)alamin adenosyltransferase
MKIYTRTGDDGETRLFGGSQVPKDDIRIEAYGTVDELCAVIGLVRTKIADSRIDSELLHIQNDLFAIGAELATPDPESKRTNLLAEERISSIERTIDQYESGLVPLQTFILPGGCEAAALLHLARTVARRAERRMVSLAHAAIISRRIIVYVNRLSDLLFVLARAVNQQAGHDDVPWASGR